MAILNVDTPPKTSDFRTQEELKTSTVFDKELTVEKIKYQVDGMRWEVSYFNQILNINDQPVMPDINLPETSLSYNRIDKLDIYVSSGLPSSDVIDVTGSGTINAGFVPYYGDAFIATLAGGRIGIFVITSVTKEYYNTHDIYQVEYKLSYFADTSSEVYNDLIHKVVNKYVYDKDAINTFSNPVILDAEYKRRIALGRVPGQMLSHYLDIFYDNETTLLRLPTTVAMYIDQMVNHTILKVYSINDDHRLLKLSRLDKRINGDTIWDAVLKRDITILDTCVIDLGYMVNRIASTTGVKVATYLGIEYVVGESPAVLAPTPDVVVNPIAARKPVTLPVTQGTPGYILASEFYTRDPNFILSDFETALMQYISGELPNRDIIDTLIADYKYWPYDVQYVIVPMLMIMVKSLVVNTYTPV